jgi:hypothetical protein
MVDGFGNPERGKIGANLLEARRQVLQLMEIGGGQSLLLVYHHALFVSEKFCIKRG